MKRGNQKERKNTMISLNLLHRFANLNSSVQRDPFLKHTGMKWLSWRWASTRAALQPVARVKSHPPALHSMVGWDSSALVRSWCWSWFWSFYLPGVLWMGPARLHLNAGESCVSGTPTVFFFFFFASDNSGFFFFERLHQKLIQMRLRWLRSRCSFKLT